MAEGEVAVAEVVAAEGSLPAAEAVVVDVAGSHLVAEVVAEDVGVVEEAAVGVEVWAGGRRLLSSLTDTPGSSLPGARRTPW